MKAKEKAHELIDKMYNIFIIDQEEHHIGTAWRIAKQCALIAVDEVLKDADASSPFEIARLEYWQQVRTEIENL